MSEVLKNADNFSLNSYFDENREMIDQAIVSLRFMKEVDNFLEMNDVTQREFAGKLGYSEAYISQLMAGTKKINTSFINKLEMVYDLVVKFKIEAKQETPDSRGGSYYKPNENKTDSEGSYFFNSNTQNFLKMDFESEAIDFVELDS